MAGDEREAAEGEPAQGGASSPPTPTALMRCAVLLVMAEGDSEADEEYARRARDILQVKPTPQPRTPAQSEVARWDGR
jgi:hypothetical protein